MATAAVLGLPAERLLSADALERAWWANVASHALAVEKTRQENQARANAAEIAKALRPLFQSVVRALTRTR